jgi:hypothetical protein
MSDKELKKQLAKAKKDIKKNKPDLKGKKDKKNEEKESLRTELAQIEKNRKKFEEEELSRIKFLKSLLKKNVDDIFLLLSEYSDQKFAQLLSIIPYKHVHKYFNQIYKTLETRKDEYSILTLLEIIKYDKLLKKKYSNNVYLNETYGSLDQLIDHELKNFDKISKGFVTKKDKKYFDDTLERLTRLKEVVVKSTVISPQEIEEVMDSIRNSKKLTDFFYLQKLDELYGPVTASLEESKFLTLDDYDKELFFRKIKKLIPKEVVFANPRTIRFFDKETDTDREFSPKTKDFNYTHIERCMDEYFYKPWIQGYDKIFYVKSNTEDVLPESFYVPNSKIIINGEEYYQGTRSLDVAMCVGRKKDQNGKNLSFESNQSNKMYNITVIYKLKDGNLVQDEDLFKLEKQWIANKDKALITQVLEMLKTTTLSQYNIEGDDKLSTPRIISLNDLETYFDKQSAKNIEDKIYKENINNSLENYFKRIGGIIIFLNDKYLKKQAVYFNKQLAKHVYNVDDIINFTPREILQDIYNNPRIPSSEIDSLNREIESQLNKYIINQGKRMMFLKDPTQRHMTESEGFTKQLTIQNYKKICENEGFFDKGAGWDIIYYNDNDRLYCFNLLPILEQISEGNYINPHTGNRFSEEFINRLKHYSIEDIKKSYFTELGLDDEEDEDDEKLPLLSDFIYKDINDKEISLVTLQADKDFVCTYYKKYIAPKEKSNKISSLEMKLQKTQNEMKLFQEYCTS